MKTQTIGIASSVKSPTLWFFLGLVVVMLAMMLPFIPNWQTFIHMWRVETAASALLLCTLVYHFVRSDPDSRRIIINDDEWRFIVLPIVIFVFWSALSALWAPSWKSAIHHSLVWAEYLTFYLVFRQMMERRGNTRLLLTVLVLTLLLYSLPAIVEYAGYLVFGGATSIGIRFAKYGEQIVTLLPLVLLAVVRMRGKKFVLGAAAVSMLWLLIFCSLGRANYFLFGAVFSAMFIGSVAVRRYRPYGSRFAILGATLVLVTLLLHVPSLFTSEVNIPTVNRFTSTADLDNSNNFRRLMITLSGEMIRENPILGIGADNFGMQVNNYRQAYGAKNPGDVNLANAEDQIPGHAHNEYLQLTAELGLIGAAIMAWLLFGIWVLAYRSLRRLRSGSLYPAAAVMGLGAFLLSSLVSSYSFRVMQNGIVFFFVLAVASKFLFRSPAEEPEVVRGPQTNYPVRLAFAAGLLVCVALLAYHGLRVSSVIMTARANQTRFLADAQPLYDLAMRLDDENPDARHNFGMRLFRRQRYSEAAEYLESAIRIGRAPSSELSYLATAQELSGDAARAESTMKSTCDLYPRSAFALTRFATVLDANGKTSESASLFARARSIDERAALSWRAAIDAGPKALSEMAARDKSYMHLMELNPESSIYAVVTERYLKHPEEERFSLVKVTLRDE